MATTDDNRIFVDTNVLLAATDTSRDCHAEAVAFLDRGFRGDWRLFVIPQILREYLVVATRPLEANGLGLSPSAACGNVRHFSGFLHVLPENADTAEQLLIEVGECKLKGKRIHDANLVAAMTCHGLRKLKTYNPTDFKAFPALELL